MIHKILTTVFVMAVIMPLTAAAADHKMVIQVNTSQDLTHKMALLGAKNLKTQLGKDNVDVEVVAYGPGIKLLKPDNWTSKRVNELRDKYGVKFSVCEGTLKAIARKRGKMPELIAGVQKVPTGTLRILELQEKGYSYIRP